MVKFVSNILNIIEDMYCYYIRYLSPMFYTHPLLSCHDKGIP